MILRCCSSRFWRIPGRLECVCDCLLPSARSLQRWAIWFLHMISCSKTLSCGSVSSHNEMLVKVSLSRRIIVSPQQEKQRSTCDARRIITRRITFSSSTALLAAQQAVVLPAIELQKNRKYSDASQGCSKISFQKFSKFLGTPL